MTPLVLHILTFCSATLAVLGLASLIFDLFFRHRLVVAERLNEEFRGSGNGTAAESTLFKDLKRLHTEAGQKKPSRWQRFAQLVEQSGLRTTPERLVILAMALGWLLGTLAFLASLQLWLGAVGFAIGFSLPLLWVPWQRKRRIAMLRSQLPDAFELMSRAIQAGQTVTSALQVVADNFDDLLAREFRACHEQQHLGLPLPVALNDLAHRTGVVEMRMFAVTLTVQRQSGGNPVEMLNNLATVIRKRLKLLDRVQVLTSEGRMQALVLLLLPFVLFATLSLLNWEYVAELYAHPEIVAGAMVSEVIGALWIHKIVNFEF